MLNEKLKPEFALITGASSGIGAVYAERMAKKGFNLILVARNIDKLNTVAERIRNSSGVTVEVVSADLNKQSELEQVEKILASDSRISTLINNAGFGSATKLIESDVSKMEQMINLNVLALTRLTYAAVPNFLNQGRGTIINISSIVAISPETLNGVYAGSKAFVLAFTQSLQHELADKGLRIQAVLPGATATDFWGVAGLPVEYLPKEIVMSSEDLVDSALKGLELGEVVTIPSLQDKNEWDSFERARREMSPKLSSSIPAARYGVRH